MAAGTQDVIYNYLIGCTEPKSDEQIMTATGLGEGPLRNALYNLGKRGCILSVGNVGNRVHSVVPGVPFARGVGGNRGGSSTPKARRSTSTHPAVIRFRAALDDLMEAFIAIEHNVVSDSDLRALEQMRAVAKAMVPESSQS